MNSARMTHSQRLGTPPPKPARLAALRFVLDCHAKRGRLLDKSGPDDGTEVKEDSANEYRST